MFQNMFGIYSSNLGGFHTDLVFGAQEKGGESHCL